MDKNNPTYKLAEKAVDRVVKDVSINEVIGAQTKADFSIAVLAVLKDSYYFNALGGKFTTPNNYLRYKGREGFHERDRNNGFSFEGFAFPKIMEEKIILDQFIESEMMWDNIDLKDIAGDGGAVKDQMMNAILVELPIEYEKRVLAKLVEAVHNGVSLHNDQGLTKTALVPAITLDLSLDTDEIRKSNLRSMITLHNNLMRTDNTLIYQPPKDKWEWIITPELDAQLQELQAFQIMTGDKNYDNALNNKPTKLLNGSLVTIDQALPREIPFMLKPVNGAFNNMQFIYTNLPSEWQSRADYVGSSTELMFFKQNNTSPFSIQLSYFATLAQTWAVGLDSNAVAKELRTYFSPTDPTNGELTGNYSITGVQDTDNTNYQVRVVGNEFNTVGSKTPTLIAGVSETIVIPTGSAPAGSYNIEIWYEGSATFTGNERLIHRSATYMHRNRTNFLPEQAGDVSNQAAQNSPESGQQSAGPTPEQKEARAKAKAEAKAELKEKAKQIMEDNKAKAKLEAENKKNK